MCGIVGYIGKNQASDYLLNGLETLEYRGYDSAGIAVLEANGTIKVTKVTGRVEHLRKELSEHPTPIVLESDSSRSELEPSVSTLETVSSHQGRAEQAVQAYGDVSTGLDKAKMAKNHAESGALHQSRRGGVVSEVGIGHTRWATHGGVLERNAHPHWDQNKEFFVIHNGIIENYQEIKKLLTKHGYKFYSDTDTEVIPNLISFNYKKLKNIEKAFIASIQALRGAYAVVMTTTHDTETLFAAKLSSPLAIGVGEDELFIGSDALPMISYTQKIVFLEDNEIAIVRKDGYRILDAKTEKIVNRPTELVELEEASSDIGDFPDFMSKEIHEAPQTVRSSMLGRLKVDEGIVKLGGLELVQNQLSYIDRIIIIACGTSYYAGMVGEYLLEEIAGIPVEVQQASEFRYRTEPLSRSTAVLVISQSGETADAIAALKKLDGTGILRLGIVNAPGSTLARMTDAGIYCHAGPEKAVASTKAFIAQVTVLILMSLYLSKNYPKFSSLTQELNDLPKHLEKLLSTEETIAKIARKYAHHKDFLYIGRRYAFPVALEGSLKIKEISYIHAEGFAGGEMKHGPLALIDANFPTFAIALSNDLEEKSMSNMQEIHARGGPIVALVDDINSEASKLATDVIVIPKVSEPLQPILSAVVTHLFAYHAAKELGRDIDKPRNLAKSVTVE
jgi:glucosamine--fructose-6-phosphate aminotransferase (isomerizing)